MLSFVRLACCGLALALLPAIAAPAGDVQAIETDGSGVLTICRNWLIYRGCKDYNHVAVPTRIALGDRVELEFGTNRKEYRFPVARIVQEDRRCTLYSEAGGDARSVNRIVVDGCTVR